jgi:hypothetical protein
MCKMRVLYCWRKNERARVRPCRKITQKTAATFVVPPLHVVPLKCRRFRMKGGPHDVAIACPAAGDITSRLISLLDDHRKSNFGATVSVAEAARAAIAKLQ